MSTDLGPLPPRLTRRQRAKDRLGAVRRQPRRSALAALAAAAAVAAALAGPHGKSAGRAGWTSGDLVGVKGEPAGTCATAYARSSSLLNGDQWIVCGAAGQYRCYRRRMHALDFKPQPVRPIRFDADCKAALAVVRKAGILR